MDKKRLSIIVFIIGIITLIAGLVFLIVKLTSGPSVHDGEYLVSIGKWTKEDEEKVVWEFTEIGKGTLTTNGHVNDYDFVWVLDGDTMKIQTDWLYDLNDEFKYSLDRGNNILTLTRDEETYKFIPLATED